MKRFLLSLVITISITTIASAQEASRNIGTETKKGTNILPAAGDIAIGIDASPFLKYIGNLLTESSNEAPEFNGKEGSLIGKYFLTDKSAIRANLTFDFGSYKNFTEVNKFDSQNDEKVEDTATQKNNQFILGLGYELRRGYGRLQASYGGEFLIGTVNSKQINTYGNPLSSTYQGPRTLENSNGKAFLFGLGGFVGVEYFVAPKLSIGSELGLSFTTINFKDRKIISEFWNVSKDIAETQTENQQKYKNAAFRTNTSGSINLTFHF